MRPSPDGKREVMEIDYPLQGSNSRVMLLEGPDLPIRIGICAPGISVDDMLKIINRPLAANESRYEYGRYVTKGMVRLHEKPYQSNDTTYCARGGAVFGMGLLAKPPNNAGILEPGELGEHETSTWLVTTKYATGLLLLPLWMNALHIREGVKKAIHGEFCVELISAGTMVAHPDLIFPGWRTVLGSYSINQKFKH